MTKHRTLKLAVPIIFVLGAAIIATALVKTKPQVSQGKPDIKPPIVRVMQVTTADLTTDVKSQGSVQPVRQTQLVAEVPGRIIDVAANLAAGAFVESGDLLARIDPFDFRQAVIAARADLARAELREEQERAESKLAKEEWSALGEGEPDPLTARVPQLKEAEAARAAAQARLDKAKRDLERTEIRAPYAGRIRTKNVDKGQFVGVGTPIAAFYGIDAAEVVLPVAGRDMAFLDVPLAYRNHAHTDAGNPVTIKADFAGRSFSWQGSIVRVEGEIDPKTRMVNLIARVANPYMREQSEGRPPLSVGMYVEAVIRGRKAENTVVIPRSALRDQDTVLVVDDDDRLQFRKVDVLRLTTKQALIQGGLSDGERIAVSRLEVVTDGMRVQPTTESLTPG